MYRCVRVQCRIELEFFFVRRHCLKMISISNYTIFNTQQLLWSIQSLPEFSSLTALILLLAITTVREFLPSITLLTPAFVHNFFPFIYSHNT